MSDASSWVSLRRPSPPGDLAARLEVTGGEEGSLVAVLTKSGRSRLEQACGCPGRVRESAFRLLEADALLTYACEAALEHEDPVAALRGIVAAVGR